MSFKKPLKKGEPWGGYGVPLPLEHLLSEDEAKQYFHENGRDVLIGYKDGSSVMMNEISKMITDAKSLDDLKKEFEKFQRAQSSLSFNWDFFWDPVKKNFNI